MVSWLVTFFLVQIGIVQLSETAQSTSKIWLRILPVGLCAAVSMACGNLAYLYISVPLIQMLKAVTPVVTMLSLFAVKLEKLSHKLVVSILLLSVGSAVACYGAVKWSWLGFAFMIMSVFAQSTRMVYAQFLLSNIKLSVFDGLYYFSPTTLFFMCTFIVGFELPALMKAEGLPFLIANARWLAVCGTAGFGLNFVIYGVVKTSGSLTLNMLVILDNIIVVLFSYFFLNQHVSFLQACGYGIAMTGNFLYVWVRLAKPQLPHKPDPRIGKFKAELFDDEETAVFMDVHNDKQDYRG